jgi:hypothetical protein
MRLFARLPLPLGTRISLANLFELHIQLLEPTLQTRAFTEIERFDRPAGLMHGCESGAANGSGRVLEEAAREG